MSTTTHGRLAKALSERLPDTVHVLLDDGPSPNVAAVDPDRGVVVVRRDERTMILEDDGWIVPGGRADPDADAMDVRLSIVAKTGIPTERIVAIVSAPNARGSDHVVEDGDDDALVTAILTRFAGMDDTDEATAVALGAYASDWLAHVAVPDALERLLVALRVGTERLLPSGEIVFGTDRLTVDDLFERDVFAPAVLVAASEDWALVARSGSGAPGFHVELVRDLGSILGWSLTGVRPATPYTVLGPVFAKLRSCVDAHGTLVLDGLVHQYAAWMEKHAVDGATETA